MEYLVRLVLFSSAAFIHACAFGSIANMSVTCPMSPRTPPNGGCEAKCSGLNACQMTLQGDLRGQVLWFRVACLLWKVHGLFPGRATRPSVSRESLPRYADLPRHGGKATLPWRWVRRGPENALDGSREDRKGPAKGVQVPWKTHHVRTLGECLGGFGIKTRVWTCE